MKLNIVNNANLQFLLECDLNGIRYRVLQGGTRSGKTYSALTYLIIKALEKKRRITVIACTVPHLKAGAMHDFKSILANLNLFSIVEENKTDRIFTFPNGSEIQFISADKSEKLRGIQRDIAFLNEANLISEDAFNEIDIRTSEFVIFDYNPTRRFWLHDFLQRIEPHKWDAIITTYKDNPFLSQEQILAIERRKDDPFFWAIYGEGKIAQAPDLYIRNFQIKPFQETERMCVGLDFGFRDPTAAVLVAKDDNLLYVKELFKRPFLSIEAVCDLLEPYRDYLIVADTNEPRTINEMRKRGFSVYKAKKFQGSIEEGLRLINDHLLLIDPESRELWREIVNYKPERSNKPFPDDSHLIDAMRYGTMFLAMRE